MVKKLPKPKYSIFMLSTFVVITLIYILMYHLGQKETLMDLALYQINSKNFNWFTQEGHWYRFFTNSLLHVSFLHYFMNELNFVLIYSALRREKVNEAVIILVYCTSVILGGFFHLYFNSSNPNPTALIGASGGVFGLIGLITVVYFKTKDYKTLQLTLMVDLPLNIIIPIMVPNVSWIAHLTGFIIGTIVGLLFIEAKAKYRPKRLTN